MVISTIWKILGILALVILIIFFKRRSAVWGGLTLGIIIGIIITIILFIKNHTINWIIIGQCAILGVFIGFIAEILGKVSILLKK